MTGSDDEARYKAMVEFLGTFSTLSGQPPSNLSDLSDGVTLFEALSEIAPEYFDPTTIARHLGENWALKSSNLRKLLRNLEHFYHDALRKDADFLTQTSNVGDIARSSDPAAIAELVELVAAAAVTCDRKSEFVTRILHMTPESQVQMKGIIEASLKRVSDYEDDEDVEDEGGDEPELVFGDSGKAQEKNDSEVLFGDDHLKHDAFDSLAYGDQDDLKRALADAKRELASQKAKAALQAEDHAKAQSQLKALVEDLQDRLVQRQSELISAEDELRATTSELDDAKSKLMELEEQKAQMADDLDVANSKAEQLRRAEATVVAYKRKLESVGLMNQQMTDLEDQAQSYLRQIMDLEDKVKKTNALQKTIDDLQKQVTKLEKEKAEMSQSVQTSGSEVAELKSKLSAAESAKKMYERELAELRAQQDESGANLVEDSAGDEGFTSSQSISQAREKAMRLEIENKTLREQLEQLKASTDGATVATVADADPGSGSAGEQSLRLEVNRLKEELAKVEQGKNKISSDKDKLEAYTKRTLAKFQEKYLRALSDCKNKLKEKQDKIEALEVRSSSEKAAQRREERLLSSTIYELGLALMQIRLKERFLPKVLCDHFSVNASKLGGKTSDVTMTCTKAPECNNHYCLSYLPLRHDDATLGLVSNPADSVTIRLRKVSIIERKPTSIVKLMGS